MTDQPMPKRSKASKPVTRTALSNFSYTVDEQYMKGLKEYNDWLHTFNGRDAYSDALAELADAVQYVTQMSMEREEIVKAARGMAEALRTFALRTGEGTAVMALAAWDALGLGAGEGE